MSKRFKEEKTLSEYNRNRKKLAMLCKWAEEGHLELQGDIEWFIESIEDYLVERGFEVLMESSEDRKREVTDV